MLQPSGLTAIHMAAERGLSDCLRYKKLFCTKGFAGKKIGDNAKHRKEHIHIDAKCMLTPRVSFSISSDLHCPLFVSKQIPCIIDQHQTDFFCFCQMKTDFAKQTPPGAKRRTGGLPRPDWWKDAALFGGQVDPLLPGFPFCLHCPLS